MVRCCGRGLIPPHRLAQLLQGLPALAAALHPLSYLLVSSCCQIQCTGSAGPLGAIAPVADLGCELQQLAAQGFGLGQQPALPLALLLPLLLLQQRLLGGIGTQEGLQLLL